MIKKMRIALLDDSKLQLEKHEGYLAGISGVEVVLKASNSEDFMKEVKTACPDVLIVDLDLGNDHTTGLEVAIDLKIPVFFASINTRNYIKDIENLKRDYDVCVDHITKPYTEETFIKSFKRFMKEIQLFSNLQYVYLDFGKQKRNKVFIDDIVYLSSDKNAGSESNNKQIHFIHRNPENLIDFSFSKMEEKGLLKSQFVTIHKSFRVQRKYIHCYHGKTATIEISVYDGVGKTKNHHLPVSENYQADIKKNFG